MPSLDDCINNLFFPGNIPASPGTTPSQPSPFVPSLDFSLADNSQNFPVIMQ